MWCSHIAFVDLLEGNPFRRVAAFVTMPTGGVFESLPHYVAAGGVAEHPEWKKFHPVVETVSYSDEKCKPDKKLPEYEIGTDVRRFLRRWKSVAEEHIKCRAIPSHRRLFDMLALSLLSCDWSDTYIPACDLRVDSSACRKEIRSP